MWSRKQNPKQDAKNKNYLEQEVEKRLGKGMQYQVTLWGKKEQRHTRIEC